MMRAFHAIVLVALQFGTCVHPVLAQEPAPAPDLSIPEWRLVPTPGAPGGSLACFDQEGVRQILRVQEHARYAYRLTELRLSLNTSMESLLRELEASQREYAALRTVLSERNTRLSEDLLSAQAATERYRGRLERRRIWPWITLSLGAVAGTALGVAVAR